MACDLCSAWAPHLMFCCRHLKFFIYMYIFLTRGHAFSFCTGPHKSCSHLCLGVWVTQDAPPPSCSLLGRGWRPGICPQACLLCPASSSPVPGGPRGLCGCGRRALSWGKLRAYRGREQAGSQATAASLAVVSVVVSVSEQVLGRGKDGVQPGRRGRGTVGGGTSGLRAGESDLPHSGSTSRCGTLAD